MLHPILAALVELKDYHGGTNPLLVVLACGLLICLILTSIGYGLWSLYKTFRFNNLCSVSKLTGREVGALRTFMRRLHVKEPLDAITKKSRFDEFMGRVGHHYEKLGLSEEDLAAEQEVFSALRYKLHLPNTFKKKRLYTSRALPKDYPLNIICWDEITRNVFTFSTRVIDNNELFLGIAPPDEQISSELIQQGRLNLEVSFIRQKDAEYMFESHLVRAVDHPQIMWYIAQSEELLRGNVLESINTPALIMITNPDDQGRVEEFNVIMYHLTNKGCTFRCDDTRHPFDQGPRVLISFELPNGSFTLRGAVINVLKRRGEFLYRLNFDRLSDDDNTQLLKYMLDLQREKKQRLSKDTTSPAADAGSAK